MGLSTSRRTVTLRTGGDGALPWSSVSASADGAGAGPTAAVTAPLWPAAPQAGAVAAQDARPDSVAAAGAPSGDSPVGGVPAETAVDSPAGPPVGSTAGPPAGSPAGPPAGSTAGPPAGAAPVAEPSDGQVAAAGDAEAGRAGRRLAAAEAGQDEGPPRPPAFEVRLANFEGPFDLLLSLISKHQLDVTEVALSRVTDEFIAHIRALGPSWDLDQATEFLVVAATLLDLKAARLLPSAEVEDEEDLALLEARDLLFARLLQYRAYKQVAAHFRLLEAAQAARFPRAVPLEPRFAELMPEVLLTVTPEQLARIAAEALRAKPPPTVSTTHVHAVRVSIREHASILRERLARSGQSTFRGLTQDCEHTLELVARFLALLELYREGAVAFDQVTPLGELWVRWTGTSQRAEPTDSDDVDEEYG